MVNAMNIHHLSFALVVGLLLASCNKDNPGNNDNPGGGDEPQKNTPVVILQQDFTGASALGAFTVLDKTRGGVPDDENIWKREPGDKAKYGAQSSGTIKDKSGNKKSYLVESWLISPEIDLTNYTDAYLCFNHAFAYVDSGEPKDFFGIKVSADGGTTWVDLSVPKWLVSHSYFELAQSGNVPLGGYKGKKIKFALVYKSLELEVDGKKQIVAPTWEITSLIVSYEKQSILPDDEGDKYKSIPKWMEMPQVTNESAWHAHTTILRFNRVRDYSFSYNEPYLVSDWVAYPLYADMSKDRVDREDSEWVKDPFLSKQCDVTTGSYPDVNYDRGHQIPSRDRSGGAMTNQHTFYCSNVTPQLHDFNGGIWKNLEEAVRTWSASADTMYVVTGCVVDSNCPTVQDRAKQAVAIPKAYYKALLHRKGSTYKAAGVYLEHTNAIAGGNYKDYEITLKELEKKTGMTFFVNLPADQADVKNKLTTF